MKPIIYTTTLFLALAATAATAHATGSLQSPSVPHLSHSAANPSNSRVPWATYHVGVHVSGYALSELIVDVPKDFTLSKDISVRNKAGKNIEAKVSVTGEKATFVFAQPVAPETMLEVVFKSVRTSTIVSQVWLLPVSGKRADTETVIPLGTARIHTYD
ncbi:MAG: DUF2808 domain-containing protein [Thermosynechococcaceae cyanobacterium MS004]|nr:DUF2808 domain-containing protein [Thermosynechococcaceae cyanobacterium MS004]